MKPVLKTLSAVLVIVFLSSCSNLMTPINSSNTEKSSEASISSTEKENASVPASQAEDKTKTENDVSNNGPGNANPTVSEQPAQQTSDQTDSTQINETKPDTNLKLGDSGEKVKELQTKLNKFNYKLNVDGKFGPATNFAVKDFQKKVNLNADGIVGSEIIAKLDSTPAKAPYLYTPPAKGNTTNTTQYYQSIVNSNNCPSNTQYFIYVSLSNHEVCIFSGSNHNWTLIQKFSCSIGKSSTPTIKGRFTVGTKGSYFVTDNGLICKYYTQIKGDYLFHSILYYPNGKVADSRLGVSISHGCIRLATTNALYIYNNIPSGTAIWIK